MPIIVRKKKKHKTTKSSSFEVIDSTSTSTTTATATTTLGLHPLQSQPQPSNLVSIVEALHLKSKETIIKEVDVAILNLQRGIRKRIKRSNTTTSATTTATIAAKKMIDTILLPHIHHCFVNLQQHVNVLQMGLHCYMYQLLPHIYTTIVNSSRTRTTGSSSSTTTSSNNNNNRHRTATTTTGSADRPSSNQRQRQPQHNNNLNHNTDDNSIILIKNAIQHLFYWLLHLHDGYIYTISGECRHVYDQQQQQQQHDSKQTVKFKSHLNTVTVVTTNTDSNPNNNKSKSKMATSAATTTSNNGNSNSTTSQLYSSDNIYSGTSWDEYMDPTNGLRYRLLRTVLQIQKSLSSNHQRPMIKIEDIELLWEEMTTGDDDDMNSPGYALEQIITHIEQQMLQIQMMFTKLTGSKEQYICNVLQKALLARSQQQHQSNCDATTIQKTKTIIPTVTLHWKDKMESLRITSNVLFGTTQDSSVLLFERFGNTFQTCNHNTESVLPLHYTTIDQWWNVGGMNFIIIPPPPPLTNNNILMNGTKKRRIIATNDDDDDDNTTSKLPVVGTSVHQKPLDVTLTSNNNINATNNGLVVKMKSQDKPTNSTGSTGIRSHNESVNDIKLQFGVNVHDRENAYDIVQAEEAGATYDAEQIDQDVTIVDTTNASSTSTKSLLLADDNNDDKYKNSHATFGEVSEVEAIDDEIQHALQRVKCMKRALLRLLNDAPQQPNNSMNNADDEFNTLDVNVWNAREVLREAYMAAGDVLLWSIERRRAANKMLTLSSLSSIQQDTITLKKAIQYFTTAKHLVLEQQKLHKTMNPDPSNDVLTYTFFCRNLLLLQIKSQINIGIGYIQLGMYGYPSERDPNRKLQFEIAVRECQIAYDMTDHMTYPTYIPQLPTYELGGDDDLFIRRDQLEARQLRSFTFRWKATALWYLYKKSESFRTIDKVMHCSMLQCDPFIQNFWCMARKVSTNLVQKNEMSGLIDVLIDVYLETYDAWTTIADLASRSLERMTVSSLRDSNQSKDFCDAMLDYVETSLSNAAKVSRTLQNDLEQAKLAERYDELCSSNRLLPETDLLQSDSDIKEWWKRRITIAEELAINKQSIATVERGDLFSNAQHQIWEDLPTRRFILQPHTRRSKYNLGGNGADGSAGSSRGRTSSRNVTDANRSGKSMSESDQQLTGLDKAEQAHHQTTRRYRIWREDMVYDSSTNSYIPNLVYPSIAPPMPVHIQEILDRRSK